MIEKTSGQRTSSGSVRDFYEHYPYPRPIDNLDAEQKLWTDSRRRLADHHLFFPRVTYRENPSILVAGCGTSQAVKFAIRWPQAQVTGIDFSRTSICASRKLQQNYHLPYLRLEQLPIEQVGDLNQAFDLIICTGVLHHLSDPQAGLIALGNVLKPGGAMHLMVYAPYGRAGIYMMQEFCRSTGIQANEKGLRQLSGLLKALPAGHPLERLVREAPDFKDEASLADALLHPCDRAYSVPELIDFVEKANLSFNRWIRQAAYSPHCGILKKTEIGESISGLPLKKQYAAMELFRGTMLRHSFIVSHKEQAGQYAIDFTSEEWLRFIPILLPYTICIQEKLPPGISAVLINRAHTYKDLLLPIDGQEKCLFDAIDGQRTVREIAEYCFSKHEEKIQNAALGSFFEKLWWHDQIIFDTSL